MEKSKILYVDDETGNLNSFRLLLRKKYEVVTAESGAQGLKYLNDNPVPVVITDYKMPEMTGIEFLKEAKKILPRTKYILLTALSDNEIVKQAINEVGIYWYLNKPFDPDQMEQLIDNAIFAHKAELEKEEADKRLEESEESLRLVIDTAIDALLTVDESQKIVKINPAGCTMFGYTSEDIIGKSLTTLIATDPAKHEGFVRKFGISETSNKRVLDGDVLMARKKDGSILLVETAISKMFIQGQWYFNAIVRDVSRRVADEQSIRESEARFRGVFDSMIDVFVRSDMDGKIVMVSPSVESVLGHNPEQIVGQPVSVFYSNADDRTHLLEQVKKHGILNDFETQVYKSNGEIALISANSKFYFDEDGNPLGLESIFRDITEKKKSEEEIIKLNTELEFRVIERTNQLQETINALKDSEKALTKSAGALKLAKLAAEEANQAKSSFLANMSHEIRTPMNAILGFSELLQRYAKEEPQTSYIQSIISSGKALLSLINEVLDLSKIEAGKLEINVDAINVGRLVSEIEQMFALKIQSKKLKFILDIDPNTPKGVILDEVRLRQVFVNLVSNAIKFTSEGSVTFRLYSAPSKRKKFTNLFFEVEDSGIGISPKFQNELFEAFSQQQGQDTKKYGGTGLGLAITKNLVSLMNGEIAVESKMGKGTKFTVQLKNVELVQNLPPMQENGPLHYNFQKGLIAVADDNEMNRQYFVEIFRDSKIEVMLAENGEELLEICNNRIPDVIYTDIVMPVMDGHKVIDEIKRRPNLKEVPVIAITASAMQGHGADLEFKAFDHVAFKPIRIEEILSLLALYVGHTKSHNLEVSDDDNGVVNLENIENVNALLLAMQPAIQQWELLKEKQPIKKVKEFSIELARVGEEMNAVFLTEYSNNLKEVVDRFDIEKMLKMLNDFELMQNQLKNQN